MKIEIRNLGVIKHIELEPKPLTIITRKNNSGKTYAMYTLWALASLGSRIGFSNLDEYARILKTKGSVVFNLKDFLRENWEDLLNKINKSIPRLVASTFDVDAKFFKDANIKIITNFDSFEKDTLRFFDLSLIDLEKNSLFEVTYSVKNNLLTVKNNIFEREVDTFVFRDYLSSIIAKTILSPLGKSPFLMPTERVGLNLFFNDLNTRRKNINNYFSNSDNLTNLDISEVLHKKFYSMPIEEYINFLNEQEFDYRVKNSFLAASMPYLKKFISVDFKKEKGKIYFQDTKSNELSLHLASSAIKSNLALWVYLNNVASNNNLLMIDEPEINLHPDAQRHMARLIVFLVNKGIKVALSTHSDYFIREINSLIMLNNDFPEKKKILNDFKYDNRDKLSIENVGAYCFEEGKAVEMPIDNINGIQVDTFDGVINSMNTASSVIQFLLEDQ